MIVKPCLVCRRDFSSYTVADYFCENCCSADLGKPLFSTRDAELAQLRAEVERLRHQMTKPRVCDTEEINALRARVAELEEFQEQVIPFLQRLIEPRFDKFETNDYVNGSTDAQNALKAATKFLAARQQP